MWDGMNRRRFPRIQHPCHIRLKRKDSKETIATLTENIGCGGICVFLKEDLGLFSIVSLEIDLEDGLGWFGCDAAIVWVVRKEDESGDKKVIFDTGIEFNNLEEKHRKRIENMVDKFLAQNKQKA